MIGRGGIEEERLRLEGDEEVNMLGEFTWRKGWFVRHWWNLMRV